MDTLIFAHINDEEKSVDLISIPRDLYYNGRKINAYPYMYGMVEFKRIISNITGYKIDKYIIIDMYAFVDVVDLIGGVDIHLDEAVIDPTYKTVDNGVSGTLHYEPGDYHLNGKEALRLARSRHTSSDFARAERQQKILEALQSKAKNLGLGDAATIYDIIQVVLDKTDTDISITEAVRYYFKYQNFKINSNHVMTSGNILYVPPYTTKEQCDVLLEEVAKNAMLSTNCDTALAAYTLLPKDDNWDIIKWYFRQIFDGAGLSY